jgi:hypothetical protein
MENRRRAARRHGFIPSSQLCNRLLHNWTHPPFGTFSTQGVGTYRRAHMTESLALEGIFPFMALT